MGQRATCRQAERATRLSIFPTVLTPSSAASATAVSRAWRVRSPSAPAPLLHRHRDRPRQDRSRQVQRLPGRRHHPWADATPSRATATTSAGSSRTADRLHRPERPELEQSGFNANNGRVGAHSERKADPPAWQGSASALTTSLQQRQWTVQSVTRAEGAREHAPADKQCGCSEEDSDPLEDERQDCGR